MSSKLQDFKIKGAPKKVGFFGNHEEQNADHLNVRDLVCISVDGMAAHSDHQMWSNVALGAGVGFVALPLLAGFGGIGLAMGGEAMGIGALEVAAIGSGAGAAGGKVLTKENKGWFSKSKQDIPMVDAIGVVKDIRARWWDQPGSDVQVVWFKDDLNGDPKAVATSWHDPRVLYSLEKK